MGIVSVITRVLNNESIMRDLYINEPVLESGWYYSDEVKVPGTGNATLNEGHVIADSLMVCPNTYNITPQYSTIYRDSDQVYM